MKKWNASDFGTDEEFKQYRDAAFEIVDFDYDDETACDRRDLVYQGMLAGIKVYKHGLVERVESEIKMLDSNPSDQQTYYRKLECLHFLSLLQEPGEG